MTVRDSLFLANRATDYSEWGMGGAIYNQGTADSATATATAQSTATWEPSSAPIPDRRAGVT